MAILPDTAQAMEEAWQDNWYHADRLAEDAHELFEFPNRESYLSHTGGMPQTMFNTIANGLRKKTTRRNCEGLPTILNEALSLSGTCGPTRVRDASPHRHLHQPPVSFT